MSRNRITLSMIREYREYRKMLLHGDLWHEFMNRPTSIAISYAETCKEIGDAIQDVQRKAQEYLRVV